MSGRNTIKITSASVLSQQISPYMYLPIDPVVQIWQCVTRFLQQWRFVYKVINFQTLKKS
jgi:hypothetical protein